MRPCEGENEYGKREIGSRESKERGLTFFYFVSVVERASKSFFIDVFFSSSA